MRVTPESLAPTSATTLMVNDVIAGDDASDGLNRSWSRGMHSTRGTRVLLPRRLREGHCDCLTAQSSLHSSHEGGGVRDRSCRCHSTCSQGGTVETRQVHASAEATPSTCGPKCDADSVTRREGGTCSGAS